jgi:soluble lytic murein transglycosylase
VEFARQLIRMYPALPPAAAGLADLETLRGRDTASVKYADRAAAVEVDVLRGDRESAAKRLRALEAAAPRERRSALALRRAEILRAGRRFESGLEAAGGAVRAAVDSSQRAKALLERARLLRDSRRPGSLAAFDSVLRIATDPAVRGAAAWERAWELEGEGRWPEARAAYTTLLAGGGARADDAAVRIALLWLAEGEREKAVDAIAGAGGDRGEFWRGVMVRPFDRAASDRALAAVAARPGYDFYSVAARETLAASGWNGQVAADSCRGGACDGLELARHLAALGANEDAHLALQRWNLVVSAAGAPAVDSVTAAARWLAAGRIAYGIGRIPLGIRFGQKAVAAVGARAAAWGALPWAYPPAYDSLYRALPDSLLQAPIDRELLRAVAWQESKFDPAARSRSNALGLYQMKLDTGGDVARWLRHPPPTEARLTDPAISLRYGVAYIDWLLRRFDRNVVVAISAYNSGPSAVTPIWRDLVARGGEALYCEMIQRAETRDYIRRILAARQAYREMRPIVRR